MDPDADGDAVVLLMLDVALASTEGAPKLKPPFPVLAVLMEGAGGCPKVTGAVELDPPPPKEMVVGAAEVLEVALPKRLTPVLDAAAGAPKGEGEGGAPKPKVGLAPDGGPPKREEEPPALGLLSAQAGSLPSAFLALGLPSRPVSQAGQVCWSSRLREKHPSHLHPLS